MFDRDLARLDPTPESDDSPRAQGGDSDDTSAAQTEQLKTSRNVLSSVLRSFDGNKQILERLGGDSQASADAELLRRGVASSVEQIETLRRIFFSVIDHLRDTLRRQVDVADQTRDATTMADDPARRDALGPLAARQQLLSTMSQQIAESLQEQSEQPMPTDADAGSAGQAEGRDAADRLRQAAGHVGAAKAAMDLAFERMSAEPPEPGDAADHQAAAIQKLTKALQLLAPPPPREKPQEQEDDQQQQQEQQQGGGAEEKKSQPPQAEPQPDMSRLLQSVRDRDAQRQRDKRNRRSSRYAPVEKDW
jgi:hypothetical protein